MHLIDQDTLIIPDNRQREEFPEVEMLELEKSIEDKGLMNPPTVRNDGVTLVGGERRSRAVRNLHLKGIPFRCNGDLVPANQLPTLRLSELTPLQLREAELEENTIRLDLTWQEKAKAIAGLHALRADQASSTGTSQSITKTAQEIHGKSAAGSVIQSTHEAILLHEHLDNPLVATAKSQKEAVKIVRKLKEAEHRQKLADTFDLTKVEHKLFNDSMTRVLPTLEAGQFDCILTDPPYGVNADQFGDMADCGHNYEDSWENALTLYRILAKEGFRVCKPEAHLYAFCDITHFQELADEFAFAGWTVWPKPLLWVKGNGMLPRPEHGPRYTYEAIVFATKGDKRTLKVDNDTICISRDSNLLHGAQKPVALYTNLLSRSVLPGSKVLDCFGGSGPIIPAANELKCTATYIELIPENYAIAVSRLNPTDNLEFSL